jgi:gliding motility-associated-like protein
VNCNNYTSAFQNEANSSQINSYFWDFGVTGSTADTSNIPQPSFTFPDTGTYKITLIINRNQECSDTATSFVKIYPGFNPGFAIMGSCYQTPFQFNDTTKAAYGQVNSWRWNFGESSDNADTSLLKNATYQYPSVGPRTVSLLVGSSKGCTATIQQTINVLDKPALQLPFHDTLICSIDSLPLIANGSGTFSWTPVSRIINENTANPTVFPQDTTIYYVDLDENGCKTRDSIKVNVLKFLTLAVAPDTVTCYSDSILLRVTSHALSYVWSPATDLSDPLIKTPKASPKVTTRYSVTANLGKCQVQGSINIKVSPYPMAFAGNDTSICFGDRLQLHGAVSSITYDWSPTTNMINAHTLSPTVATTKSMYFVLTARGYDQCPKSSSDTISVTVIPPVKAFAGHDTTVTDSQPLMLHASGGENYQWTPSLHMNNAGIANPVITLSNAVDSIIYQLTVSTAEGCAGEDAIKIVVYKTGPQIFVPDAFTPNHDGKNDGLYPVLVGMKQLDYFRVYNRLGQLVFATSEINKAWDGIYGGKEQPTGTFVYMAQAVNYKGETIFKKGTVLLIR